MKRSSKRLWSVLLTLAMLLSIAPVSAYAAGPWWGLFGGGDTEPYGETSYAAYYYVLDPAVSDEDSRDVENFIFIGRGSVSSQLGAPDRDYNKGGTVSIGDNNRGYMKVPADETQTFGTGQNPVKWATYPDITHEGQKYVYEGKAAAGTSSTYSIVWYRYSSSTGYNIYDRENNQNYPFDERNYCWHVDGRIEFSDKVSVTYLVYFPGDSTTSSVTSEGEKTNSATYTSYNKKDTAFSEFGKPNMSDQKYDSEGNKYTFKGWYYDKDCTEPIGNDAVISESITAYGKYEKIDESKPSSITVEVYVDGNKETLTDANLSQYLTDISVAQGTLDNGEVTVSAGSLTVPFKYPVYDAVDLKICLNGNYALQGAEGSFIYGEGWEIPMFDGGGWIIDNIDGGSTLKLYLNTLYSVKYYLDGSETEDPSDTEKYVTGQGVNETTITVESFDPEQRDAAVNGKLRNPSLKYELKLEDVPTGYTGWYKTDSYTDMHKAPYTGTAIADAAGDDKVVHCYGKKNTYDLTYSWIGLPDGAEPTLPAGGTYAYGAAVTLDGTYNKGYTTKVGHDTYTFSGWTCTPKLGANNTMPASDVTVSGTWKKTSSDPQYTVTYGVTGDEPAAHSNMPAEASHYAGDSVDVAAPLITDDTEKNGVSGTWTFNGWTSTDVTVTDGKFTMPAKDVKFTGSWKFTANTHNITINYVDENGDKLQTAYSTTQNDGSNYSFTVSSDEIPLTITNDNGQYVFDHFAAGSAALSGTLKDDVTITAVYLLDSDKNGTPDAYEATVTYEVVNGTWSDDTSENKTHEFTLKTFDTTTNTWVNKDPAPTLGNTIPTDMKPGEDYLSDGASWNTTISLNTEVTGNVTYTYTFRTEKAPGLSVEKSVVSVGGVKVTGEEIPAAIVGDTIVYEIVVKNTGNTELTGINVSDSLWTDGTTINVGGEVKPLTDTAYTIGELDVGGSVTISYNYTVTTVTDHVTTLKNTATASAGDDATGSDTATVKINGAVTITPADITIYMGGDGGYDAVVGTDGNATISNSMPRPLFYVSVPEGTDPDNLTLKGNDGREWRFEEAGLDANRVSLFYINSTGYEDQDPVRVQYSRDGAVYVEDEFDPADVQELYTEYVISIYSGGVTSVWAEFKIGSITTRYSVASETGKLRVRAVEDGGEDKNPVVGVTTMPPAGPLQPGEAAITAPEGTYYTLNDTTVSVDAKGVGLLFDGIIDSDADRTGALIAAIKDRYGTDSSYWNYQAQYLDLVDAKNGNAWVKASGNVTVYWAYPEGTGMEDDFVLYHFKGLHRDGENSGFDIEDIAKTEIETVTITKTEQGISFEVEPGGFSPFVLLSHAKTDAEKGGIDGIEKRLVTDRSKYTGFRLSYPEFSGGKVFVERYGKVTLLYSITVSGTPGTAYVVEDAGAVVKEGSLSGVIGADGKAVVYVAKTFDWNDVRTGSLKNTATVEYNDGTSPEDDSDTVETEVVVYDPVTPPVTPSEPDYKPEWLNTEDHYAYIIGYEDGTVRPYGSITRAETATIFFRLLTDEAREEYWTETNSYTDVSRGDWYNTAVSTLSRLGILGGYEDGTFRPNSGITRAEFAKIAVSFFEYEGIEAENVFTDVAHGSWYEDFVAAAAEIGLIEGYEDGSFRPESGITRAEACTIINRTLGRAPDKGHLLPESEMLTWPDNPESAWYYAQIQEATNSHEYKWLGDIEQWLEKLPERDWAA